MISRSAFVEDSMVALITVKGGCGKRTGFLLSRRNVGARFFFLQRKSIEGNLNAFEAAPKFFGEKSVESSLGYLCSFKDKSTWGFDFFFGSLTNKDCSCLLASRMRGIGYPNRDFCSG